MKDPDRQVELTTAHNEPAAGAIVALLDDAGIDAWSRPSDYIGGAVGIFGSLSMTPTTVMVRESDAARARALLEEARSDSVDIDWGEVDVGAGEAGPSESPVRDRRPAFVRFSRKLGVGFVVLTLVWTGGWLAFAVVMTVWNLATPEPEWDPEGLDAAGYAITVVEEEATAFELLLDATFGRPGQMTPEEEEAIRQWQAEMQEEGQSDGPQ